MVLPTVICYTALKFYNYANCKLPVIGTSNKFWRKSLVEKNNTSRFSTSRVVGTSLHCDFLLLS